MGKSGYLERQRKLIDAYVQGTCDIYTQYMCDMACITLHDEFGFGPERIKKFMEALGDNAHAFDPALGVRRKSEELEGRTDFLRGRMDEKLRAAMGKYYDIDFDARYPGIRKGRF